ncbi:MAG TPA: hypothetical protein PKE12_02565 [Kiritimatiellia bacterium]|nr:hypothetical protein [Kiritimatiellia bacterium]
MNPRIAVALLLPLAPVWAASPHTETFEGGLAGWRARDHFMTVTNAAGMGNPGAALRGGFAASFLPLQDAFVATGALASAAFTGDYIAAGAELLGFDMRLQASGGAPVAQPVRVRLYSGSNCFERLWVGGLASTGVWYRFRVPLLDPASGGWTNVVGAYHQFSEVLSNVTRVEFAVVSDTSSALDYLLDNIFLSRLHRAEFVGAGAEYPLVVWSELREGDRYRVEWTDDPAGVWTPAAGFTASVSTVEWTLEGSNGVSAVFQRLRLE